MQRHRRALARTIELIERLAEDLALRPGAYLYADRDAILLLEQHSPVLKQLHRDLRLPRVEDMS